MPRTLEARLTIDAQQRIVEWDHGAEALLGISLQEAQQRRCFEVVDGRDAAGKRVCGPDCPGITAIRHGRLSSGASLSVGSGAAVRRVRCRLTALPSPTGGAIVSLSADMGSASTAEASTDEQSAPAVIDRLAALAAITTSLSAETLEVSLERSLEIISGATGAEVAELFLSEPGGSGTVLTCHRGPFRRAFGQTVRFDRGEGFPGRVLASGETLLSHRLKHDPRYLRRQVKDAGFDAYVCAPLHHHRDVVGSVGLAFRNGSAAEIERARDFLLWVGGPIGTAVQASLAETVTHASNADLDDTGPEARLEALAKLMMQATGADAGEAQLLPRRAAAPSGDAPGTAWTTKVRLGTLPEASRPGQTCSLEACPVVARGRGEVLHGRPDSWPAPCRGNYGAGGLRLCVPLVSHASVVGLVKLWRKELGNQPPGRDLVTVETIARSTAMLLAEEQQRSKAEQRSDELYRWLVDAQGRAMNDDADANDPAWQRVADVPMRSRGRATPTPHLSVRCFGSFELRVDGVPVLPRAVGRKKTLTLLKILLTQPGRPVPKDALIEWLWPDGDPDTKARQLHVLVHDLRRLLEPHVQGEPTHVLTDADRYRFEASQTAHVDVIAFRTLAEFALGRHEAGDSARAMAAAESAVALYRGDLMEDEPYADWCRLEREQLRETCLELLQLSAALAGERQEWDTCLRYLRAAVRIEPLREWNHRQLMHALWAAGRRDEAVQQYHLCEDLLRRELGVRPLPETSRLLEQIRVRPAP